MEEDIPRNIKSFWSHVDNLKRNPSIPTELFYDSKTASSPLERCELFAEYFSSVFDSSDIDIPACNYGWNFTVAKCVITTSDIERRLQALDPGKSAGPDEIPPLVLRHCAPILAPHFAVFFAALLADGIFPSCLKTGFVVPIFKSGNRDNIRNYRPIVIQSSIAKIYESIILDHLYFQLRVCISPEQHGFLHHRSTITNLLHFQDFILSAFMDSCQVDCIYLDLSKAFDKVNHRLLIAKLQGYGVNGALLEWLASYLKNRMLIVKCDGSVSQPFKVLSGVPQGSHLAPLLFNLFMNDVSKSVSSNFLMFADDMKIFSRVSPTSGYQDIQQSLTDIENWCARNAMALNTSKCVVISFKRGSDTAIHNYLLDDLVLKRVHSVKDLGIILSPSLNPQEHINRISSRSNSLLGFLFRSTKDFTSPYPLVLLFKTLVRPILEYGSIIWTPYQQNHIEQLQHVQNRFIRILGTKLGYTYYNTPIEELENMFGLLPLCQRRQHADLVALFKLVNGLLDCPGLLSDIDFFIPRGTRSRTIFRRRYQPTYYAYHTGLARLLRLGSDAGNHVDFFNESVSSFKRLVLSLSSSQ